jgi:PemK-like, MazF-like toxin of type II toxin-antitoxin system
MADLSIKGKVVLVPFPFDDLSSTKLRPAVCLTDSIGPHQHVVVAFITSRPVESRLFTDVVLSANDPDFATTGLRLDSVLRLHRLVTLTAMIFQRELGFLPERILSQVEITINALFRLPLRNQGASHELLWTLAKRLPSDFEPYGQRDREDDWGPDCSCGCKHYHPLEGARGADWGICANPKSPRAGLLTFEHMGCKEFENEITSS